MREYNGNDFIKWLVIFNDFIILNITMMAFLLLPPEHAPEFIYTEPRIFFFVGNATMILAQLAFSTIINLRHLTFQDILTRA